MHVPGIQLFRQSAQVSLILTDFGISIHYMILTFFHGNWLSITGLPTLLKCLVHSINTKSEVKKLAKPKSAFGGNSWRARAAFCIWPRDTKTRIYILSISLNIGRKHTNAVRDSSCTTGPWKSVV
eukprot:COSAG02_NODE_21_length_53083_cov_95.733618_15_plen_125_part_00